MPGRGEEEVAALEEKARGWEEVASVVGITQASSQSLEAGFRYYLQVLALISLSLALLNLLPLLPGAAAAALRASSLTRDSFARGSEGRVVPTYCPYTHLR